jgi:hypothetical protein
MNVQQFLKSAKPTRARKGAAGEQSDWLHLCDFKLRGKHLQMVETRIVGTAHDQNSVSIAAQPGTYVVECRVISYGGDKRISRMRVRPQDTAVTLGTSAGAIGVDLGGMAITDVDVLASSVEEHEDHYQAWIEKILYGAATPKAVGVLRWKRGRTEIPYADGGFGDGTYKVFRLVSGKQNVGLEVEFIAPGTKYPF